MDDFEILMCDPSKTIGRKKIELEQSLYKSEAMRITIIENYLTACSILGEKREELKYSRITNGILFVVILWLIFSK